MTYYMAIDFETYPIGPGEVLPEIICGSFFDGLDDGTVQANCEEDGLRSTVEDLLREPEAHLIFHNAPFDLGCICSTWPEFIPLVFEALANDRVHDTITAEKLLNLADHGRLEKIALPDGSKERLSYKLVSLEQHYLGLNRQAQKTDADAWRTNYQELAGKPARDYPEEAFQYALDDAKGPHRIYHLQLGRAAEHKRCDPLKSETFQNAANFGLMLMTAWGWEIDPEAKAEVEAWMAEELKPEKMRLLIENGILHPGEPPRPYKRGGKNPDGSPKMTKGKKESIKQEPLKDRVKAVWGDLGKEPVLTKPSDKYPNGTICCDADVMAELAPHDRVLAEYQHRAALQKIVTTELPRMSGPVIHPNFDVLKETGRTSSWAGDLSPSGNIQNVDPRVRKCYVARPGRVLCSVDFDFLELCSLAQKCYSLFGRSVLRDLINGGVDPHAYLGSQLAMHLDENFRESVRSQGDTSTHTIYEAFISMKDDEREEVRELFKHYRTFAKPTGLGYPGGLGPDTFITYARGTFGVEVDRETAVQLREIWFNAYPEMRDYFDWVNEACQDPDHPEKYAYLSPFGMYRANASFCATANGAALQTPSAEGAKLGVFQLARECYDKTRASCLLGAHPLAFIHDQNIVEMPEDNWMHERAYEIAHSMIAMMELALPDMKIGAEPVLMRRWDKRAKPTFDEQGRLAVWEPQEA